MKHLPIPLIFTITLLCGASLTALVMSPQAHAEADAGAAGAAATTTKDWSLHLQATSVTQEHFSFVSPYAGANSLTPDREYLTSYTATIYAGYRPWQGGQFYINHESQQGTGLSKTLGIAGYPNGEIYRVDNPKPKGSLVRYFYRQVIGLGGPQEFIEDDQNQIPGLVDLSRLTVVVGKFSLNDYLDTNKYAHDPRSQFLNWGLMDTGAWDYAADTRGYTTGFMLELNQASWAVRYVAVMVPKVANQMFMEWEKYPGTARGDNLELEYRYSLSDRPGAVRLLGYMNHAHMGSYREAIDHRAADAALDLAATRTYSIKKGAVLNVEQEIAQGTGLFARLGWNDGVTETWAFTEIDRSFALGISGKGTAWGRKQDGFGLALMANGLSPEHRDFLAAGGYGFIVGDGKLNYAPERIAEVYYNVGVWQNYLQITPDFQYVVNPAFNRDRGPVAIYGLRVHGQI